MKWLPKQVTSRGGTSAYQYLLVLLLKEEQLRESHYSFMWTQYKRLDCHCYFILWCIKSFAGIWNLLLGSKKIRCSSYSFSLFKFAEKQFYRWNDQVFVGKILIRIQATSFTSLNEQTFTLFSNLVPRP